MTAMEEEMEALRKENARLRKENLFLNLMSQDVFEKVTEKLEMKRSGLRQEFDDKFNYHRFSVLHSDLYYEYIAEYHLYDTHRDFNQEDWEYFWTNYDNSCIVTVLPKLNGKMSLRSKAIDVGNAVVLMVVPVPSNITMSLRRWWRTFRRRER